MTKMVVFTRLKNGKEVTLSRGFFSEPHKALERCKQIAKSNGCPVKMKVLGQDHGIILDPVGPFNS